MALTCLAHSKCSPMSCLHHQKDEAALFYLVLVTACHPGTLSPVHLVQVNTLDLIAQFSVFTPYNSFVANISVW